jgi:hypothetical protein
VDQRQGDKGKNPPAPWTDKCDGLTHPWLAGRQLDGWVDRRMDELSLGQVLCSGDGACLPGLPGGTLPRRTAVDKERVRPALHGP